MRQKITPRALVVRVLYALVLTLPGPRLEAENLGKIDFPNSGPPAAQEHFLEGVLYLHNFEYYDVREQFQAAHEIAPDFAMAYWGEAMTHNHPLWRQVDLEAAREALARLGPTLEERLAKAPTEREKDFLRSLHALYFTEGDKSTRDQAYSATLRQMHEKYPGDHEVASFYALSILGLTNGTRDFPNYMKAASIVEEVFADNSQHPGAAHYMIHSYDDPIHAPLGLRPARVYAQIAPAASHAQHMVSHIYVALGYWDEATTANENAWRVSKQRVERKQLGVDQLDFHSFFWLHYSYLQQGRFLEAGRMLRVIEETASPGEDAGIDSYYSRMRAQQLVNAPGWEGVLPPSRESFFDLFADAWMALQSERLEEAEQLLSRMSPETPATGIMKQEIEALLKQRKGDLPAAIELLREAAAREEELPLTYGPPIPSKPSHELLGELLLEAGRAGEARRQFEKSLELAPRRALSLLGLSRAAHQSEDEAQARQALETLHEIWREAEPSARALLDDQLNGLMPTPENSRD